MESKKIVLIGDGGIGKSTLFQKICNLTNEEYRFDKKYKATDNFDFNRINLSTSNGEVIIDLWDTAGQENKGGKLRDAYLKGADGVLLLYDISEKTSIDNITTWLKQINKVCPNIYVSVIGNKSDKLNELQQCESVKLRECNLIRDLGHSNVKNFLISIKNDTFIDSKSTFWSSTITYEIKQGCLVGLEYILSNLYKTTIKIL
jgi:small GTP-binding protein